MKTIKIIIFFIIAISFNLQAVPDSLQTIFDRANKAYQQKDYATADSLYQKILKSGYESPELYYNLGNVYFRRNDVAHARLYYEKALKLSPSDEDAKANIQFLKDSKLIDDFEEVPDFILDRFYNGLQGLFGTNGWAVSGIIMIVLGLFAFMIFLFSRIRTRRKIAFFSSIILILLSLLACHFSIQERKRFTNPQDAVLMKVTTIKSSPDNSGTDLIIVHPGVKVNIKDSTGNWYEIRLPNGKTGWITKQEIEKI